MQLEAFFPARLRPVSQRTALVVLSGALVLAVAGCHPAPGPDVVATVNGKEILGADVDKIYKVKVGDSPQQKPSREQADMLRLNILSQLIDDEIIQQRATKLNIAATDEDVNAKLTEYKAPYTQEEFDKKLQASGDTLDDLKRDIRRSLTRTKLFNKDIDSKINVTDAEIADYYNAHKAEFNLIEPRYELSLILVSGNPPQQGENNNTRKAPNEAEARKEIDAIRTRILSGEDFGLLAQQFSENANSAQNGGDIGFLTESQLKGDADVYNAIQKLKPGQISDSLPVYNDPTHKAVIGYSIYRLNSRETAGQHDLSDPSTHERIRAQLRETKAQLLRYAYSEALHDQATVKNYLAEQILKEGAL